MKKRTLIISIIIIILIIFSVVIISINFSKVKESCDWRPPKDYVGPCPMNAGYYFDGNSCTSLGACVDEKGYDLVKKGIPFETGEECINACMK